MSPSKTRRLSKTVLFSTLSAALVGCLFTVFMGSQLFALRRSFEMARYERRLSDHASYLYSLVTDVGPFTSEPRALSQWKTICSEMRVLIAKSLSMSETKREKESLLAAQKNLRQTEFYFKEFSD